jgi:YD repeat-containing protein
MNSSGEVLNETFYNYKPVSETLPGSVQETFYYLKNFTTWGPQHHSSDILWQYVSTSKIEYPSILDNTVSVSNGLKTTTYYDGYDINTGKPNSVRTLLPNGKEYKSVSVPAYNIFSYSGGTTDNSSNIGMGSKVWNMYNKNMLSQEAASYNYYNTGTQALPQWKVIGAGIQTWKSSWDNNGDEIAGTGAEDQTNVWRKHKSFAWKGNVNTDGTYNSANFNTGGRYSPEVIGNYWSDFNGDGLNGWQKLSEVVSYNKFSMPIQSKDINSTYSSTKMDKTDAYVYSSISNARYNEFAFSGAEEDVSAGNYFGGNVRNVSGTVSTAYKHTGSKSLMVPIGSKGFSFVLTPRSRTYKVSVWAKGNLSDFHSIEIGYDGNTPILNKQAFQAGDWILMTGTIALGTANTEIYCRANTNTFYFDDFRVQPVDAIMNGYVYDNRSNVISILDNDNIATVFEYDEGDRLKASYKETSNGFKKTTENKYNFSDCYCSADFNMSKNIAENNKAIAFESFNPANCTYLWNFGDNTTSTAQKPTKTYTIPYDNSVDHLTISCTVTDEYGKSASISKSIARPYVGSLNVIKTGSTVNISFYGSIPGTYSIKALHPSDNYSETYTISGSSFYSNYQYQINLYRTGMWVISVSMPDYTGIVQSTNLTM